MFLLLQLIAGFCFLPGCLCDEPTLPPRLSITSSTNAKLVVSKATDQTFVYLREGETLNLTCAVVFGSDELVEERVIGTTADYDINWYLSDIIAGRLTSVKGKNSYQISIRDVVPSDSGQIRCTAKSSDGHHYQGEDEEEDEDDLGEENNQMVQRIFVKVKSKPSGSCGSSFFQCPRSHCIGHRFICDGIEDCPDGADESVKECGVDPCSSKLRCEDLRCMDPSLCCNPDMDGNCTFVPVCCLALVESNRHFFQMGVEKRNKDDLRFLHSTIYTVIGCVMAFISLIVLVTVVVCRLHVRRNHLAVHLGNPGSCRPPLGLHDLDIYFHSIQQQRQRGATNSRNVSRIGITYNINNGVQFVTGAPPPPPYQAAQEPPPPYEVAADDDRRQQSEDEDDDYNNNEENNNGDINGNSEFVNQNIVAQEALLAGAAGAVAAGAVAAAAVAPAVANGEEGEPEERRLLM